MFNHMISESTEEESKYVRTKLIEFNASQLSDDIKNRYEEINLNIKDADNQIIGGVLSVLCWNWLEVDILWIDETQRHLGHGSTLLMEIEKIAREKECTFIKLNTFSFQAPGLRMILGAYQGRH